MSPQVQTKEPRNIYVVIDRIKAELPADHVATKALLDDVAGDARYKAPEQMRDCWVKLCMVLSACLPDPQALDTPEWAKKIGRIIRDEE